MAWMWIWFGRTTICALNVMVEWMNEWILRILFNYEWCMNSEPAKQGTKYTLYTINILCAFDHRFLDSSIQIRVVILFPVVLYFCCCIWLCSLFVCSVRLFRQLQNTIRFICVFFVVVPLCSMILRTDWRIELNRNGRWIRLQHALIICHVWHSNKIQSSQRKLECCMNIYVGIRAQKLRKWCGRKNDLNWEHEQWAV